MLNTLSEITKFWDLILTKIKKRLDDDNYFNSLFSDSYVYNISGDTIYVVVGSALARKLMETKHFALINEIINEITETNFNLVYLLKNELDDKTIQKQPVKEKYFEDSKLNTSLTFDNFVVGPFNREASQAALLVAKNPGKTFNPLFLHSASGLGKTHLLHSIGNFVLREGNPKTKILYMNTNDFVEEYVKFSRGEHENESLKDYICSFDILLLDDVQFLASKVKTQMMFFAIYQKLINNGKQIVITSDRHPNELKDLEDRLVTRFNQGLVVQINEPDQNTCVQILEKKIQSNGLDITKFDNSVLYFYANKFSKNVRELEGALNRLIFHVINLSPADTITLEIAEEAVQSLVDGKSLATQINEQKIINLVADYYSLSPSQLTGKIRTGQIALARHIAMYLIRQNLDVSLKKIGDTFGGKDHTTIMNAISHVEKELKTNTQLKDAINTLQKQIKK